MQECTVQEGRGEWQPWRHAPSTPPTQQATTGRTILIQRANDGSVGLRFSRPGQMTHGPLEVTGLIPGSPSANTALKPGDLICEVDGQDISTLQESHVAGLFRGPPRSPLVLRVEPTVQVPALEERSPSNLVDQGLAWVTRNGVLPTQSIQGFEELMRRLQAVSVPMDQVDTVCGQLTTGNVIGKGANGSVMRANLQGTAVAVKHVNPRTTKPLHLLFHDLLLELTVTAEISQSKHPNVVNFVGAAAKFPAAHEQQADWSIGLVFELCDPFDLYHLLHKHKIKLTMAQKLRLARESAAGLAHLHSCGFLHRDFGSRNLLLREGHIQITDFGIARKMPRSGLNASYRPATVCGTLPWMAPEQIAGQILSPYSDVFALGTVLWELLTQTVPFSDVNDPLQHNLQLMRDALNTRDFSMGGWPIGPNARQGPTMPLSKTLQAPPDDSLEGLASGAKDDLRILVCLLHEHLPVLRPTAEEAHEVLKSLEKQLAASSSSWKTLFISHRDNRDILLGLHERVKIAHAVAKFYAQRDVAQLALLDMARWDSILADSKVWAKRELIEKGIQPELPEANAAARLMARRRDVIQSSQSVCVTVQDGKRSRNGTLAKMGSGRGQKSLREMVSCAMGGVIDIASWMVGSTYKSRLLQLGHMAKQALSCRHQLKHNFMRRLESFFGFASLLSYFHAPGPSSQVFSGTSSPIDLSIFTPPVKLTQSSEGRVDTKKSKASPLPAPLPCNMPERTSSMGC